MNVLLVEDDLVLGKEVKDLLCARGIQTTWNRGAQPIPTADLEGLFDAIIMDISLPGRDGVDLVQQWRNAGLRIPVIFLSALSTVPDRVRGLRAGGDDYLTKPFASEELVARLESLTRRGGRDSPPGHVPVSGWEFDGTKRRIRSARGEVEFQPREWALLQAVMRHPDQIMTKGHLLEAVWDIRFDPGTNVVDAMICRLRAKLETLGGEARIDTVRGKGYVFHVHS